MNVDNEVVTKPGPRTVLPRRERCLPSSTGEGAVDLAIAIIEQAAIDWMSLKYGRLGYVIARNGHSLVYRAEVESFFKSEWFEYLLSYALPDVSPSAARKALKIEEPQRRKQ